MRGERLERLDEVPGAGPQRQAGHELARHVAAELRRERGDLLRPTRRHLNGEPERRSGVRRAAAHARGDRDSLGDLEPDRWRLPPAGAELAQRPRGQVRTLDPVANDLVSSLLALDRGQLELVRQGNRLDQRHELVAAILTERAEKQAQVDLARRQRRELHGPSFALSARNSSGDRRSARSSAGWPSSTSAARAGSRTSRPRASASEPASVFRRCAKASWTSFCSSGPAGGPVRRRPTRTESTLGHGPEHAAGDRVEEPEPRSELREYRRHAIGGRGRLRREPLADLALHHHYPLSDARQLVDRPQNHGRGDPVGEVGDDLGGRRVERREVELERVAHVQGNVVEVGEGVPQYGLEPSVDLDHVHVCRRRPRAGRTKSPVRRRSPGPHRRPTIRASRSITPRMLRSTRKF